MDKLKFNKKNWHLFRKLINLLVIGFSLILFSINNSFCVDVLNDIPPPCVAFDRADLVFVGKIEKKMLDDINFDGSEISVYFLKVKKVFKGSLEKSVELKIPITSKGNELKIGKDYFIYGYKGKYDNAVYVKPNNRMPLFSSAKSDLNHVKSLNSKTPIQSITGRIQGLSSDSLKKVKFTIKNNTEISLTLDHEGFFNYETRQTGNFKVHITIPFKVDFYILGNPIVESIKTDFETILTYEPKLDGGKCDYRVIVIDN